MKKLLTASAFIALLASCSTADQMNSAFKKAKTVLPKREVVQQTNPFYKPDAVNPLVDTVADFAIEIVRKGVNEKYYEHSKYLCYYQEQPNELVTLIDINGNKIYQAPLEDGFDDLLAILKKPNTDTDVFVATYVLDGGTQTVTQDTIYSSSKL